MPRMEQKSQTGRMFWIALLLVLVLVVYPLSVGPYVLVSDFLIVNKRMSLAHFEAIALVVYAPIVWLESHSPKLIGDALCDARCWYAAHWVDFIPGGL
jgi:hypothetical protein